MNNFIKKKLFQEARVSFAKKDEAFKVYDLQPLPKSLKEVNLPEGMEFSSPEAESFL